MLPRSGHAHTVWYRCSSHERGRLHHQWHVGQRLRQKSKWDFLTADSKQRTGRFCNKVNKTSISKQTLDLPVSLSLPCSKCLFFSSDKLKVFVFLRRCPAQPLDQSHQERFLECRRWSSWEGSSRLHLGFFCVSTITGTQNQFYVWTLMTFY